MRKKKGFTLIELLAVIIVLAVIAVIATPIVLNVIEKAKLGAFKASVNGAISAYRYTRNEALFNGSELDSVVVKNLELQNGNIFNSGELVYTEDGKIDVVYLQTANYCANGMEDNIIYTKGECTFDDVTAPIIRSVVPTAYADSINVRVSAKDRESSISKYEYSLDGENYIEAENYIISISNLAHTTTYNIRLRVTNGVNLTSEETITVDTIPGSNIALNVITGANTNTINSVVGLGQNKDLALSIPQGYDGNSATFDCIGTYGDISINNGTISITNVTTDLTCDATIEPLKYAITYDANGGTNAPETQQKIYDVTLNLTTSRPRLSGYRLVGWSTNNQATEAEYLSGAEYTINEPTTLYAVWAVQNCTKIPAGNYIAGNTISYGDVSWKVMNDNGDDVTLIYAGEYATDNHYSSVGNSDWNNSDVKTLINVNFPNGNAAISNAISEECILYDNTSDSYVRLPKLEELSANIANTTGNPFWTMTPDGSNKVYIAGGNGNPITEYVLSSNNYTNYYVGFKISGIWSDIQYYLFPAGTTITTKNFSGITYGYNSGNSYYHYASSGSFYGSTSTKSLGPYTIGYKIDSYCGSGGDSSYNKSIYYGYKTVTAKFDSTCIRRNGVQALKTKLGQVGTRPVITVIKDYE